MGYKSQDYLCEACGRTTIELVERDSDLPEITCECGATMVSTFGAPAIMNHTNPAGRGRFKHLREDLKMRREASDAKQRGDFDTAKRIAKEQKLRSGKE